MDTDTHGFTLDFLSVFLRVHPWLILFLLPLALPAQSSSCAECHPAIARTFAQTGMGRSFYSPTSESVPSAKPFLHRPSGTGFAVFERDGKFYQRRWRNASNGSEEYVQESQIDYVMGSGNHVRSYLHRTARGALIELPLAWYAENGGQWAMSPGQDRPYLQPPRAIPYECMFCHNAYPRIPAGHDEAGSEPLYSGALPDGIDCRRCHGPGDQHMRAARAGAGIDAVRRAIVNPARLTPERRMELCMQCHLETVSMQLPHSIQRYGRAPFSYRPGEPLGAFEIFFDRAPSPAGRDDFEIVSSVYRLRQSQCFLRSAGKLTCTTCHNPHDVPRGAQAAAHYNSVCGTCHAATPKHAASDDCAGCHMPKRRTSDVVHAVMTDHLIQRRPPPGDLLAPMAEASHFDRNRYQGEVVPYYPSPLPETTENALYVAVAQVTQKSNLAQGLPRLAAAIARQSPARPEFYIELGQAWLGVHQGAKAIAAFEEAVKREPDSPVALLNLGDALTEANQPERAIAVLNRAVKKTPDEPLLWYQLGILGSTAALEKCIELDPDFAEAHNLLGAALAAEGDPDRAEREVMAALRINPDLPEALGNLGHLLAARGDLTRALEAFARSVQLRPDDADVRTNYAVTLAGLKRLDEALAQIDAAVKADPASADAHNFRGTLLEGKGRPAEALAEFLEAIRLRPDFDRAHLNAGRLLAAKGDRTAAEPHLRKAANSSDPNIRRQAAAALRQ